MKVLSINTQQISFNNKKITSNQIQTKTSPLKADSVNFTGVTAFFDAKKIGKMVMNTKDPGQIFKELQQEGINIAKAMDQDGCSLLPWAILNKNIDVLKKFLEFTDKFGQKINVNQVDSLGHPPLYLAIVNDKFEAVKLLAQHGAGLDFQVQQIGNLKPKPIFELASSKMKALISELKSSQTK